MKANKGLVLIFSIILLTALVSAAGDTITRFGGQVVIDEDITDDLIVAGGEVTVNGNVVGDVKAFGGQVTINGNVVGEVLVAGGNMNINGNITGDLNAYGGNVKLEGIVTGNAEIGGGNIEMGPDAKINGNLVFGSPQPPNTFKDKVVGSVLLSESEGNQMGWGASRIIGLARFIHRFFTSLFVGGIIIVVMRKLVKNLEASVRSSPIINLVLGVIAFPIIGFIGFLGTIILLFGWPITVALALGTTIVLMFCTIPVKVAIGKVIGSRIFKWKLKPFRAYLIGLFIYTIIVAIPFLGPLTRLFLGLLGFGTVFRMALGKNKVTKALPNF